jgi:biofilm PGA synthesis N-glycosyltransferase PgaC
VFWASAALLGYSTVGYPAYLWLKSKLRPRPVRKDDVTPSVSVILAAHNEAQTITDKLANLDAIDYPRDRIDVVVVDDGSTDGTKAVADAWAHTAPIRATLVSVGARRGKAHALNVGVARARGDIAVFVDARQHVAPDAIRRLVRNFADPEVGAVSGELTLESDHDVAAPAGLDSYWDFERWLRRVESATGSTIGCTGALYAIRRALYVPIPEHTLLDDVLIPLQVMLGGHRVVVEPHARVYDRLGSRQREFQRKVRTIAGNVQLVALRPRLLDPRRAALAGRFTSHKLLPRVAMPYCLMALLVASAALRAPLYRAALVGQIAFYAAGFLGLMLARRPGILSAPAALLVLNAASVVGGAAYLAPGRRDLWNGISLTQRRAAGHARPRASGGRGA